MFKDIIKHSFIGLFFGFLAYSCAQVGQPTGGEKDILPPVIIKSLPENKSVYFNEKKITIEFDENIQLKDVNKELLISPPTAEKPSVKTNMNKLIIKFIDSLKPQTTYLFDFGNSLADYNEGNVYKNYSYVFSTGAVIDSLQVSGTLVNAFDNEPILNAMVLLHSNMSDTAFTKILPNYVAKTDSSGHFTFKYIAYGTYKIFALKDASYNFTYESGTEELAFSSELLSPSVVSKTKMDTVLIQHIHADTLRLLNKKEFITKEIALKLPDSLQRFVSLSDSILIDTIRQDTIQEINYLEYSPDSLQLFLFAETGNNQFFSAKERKEKGKIDLQFNLDNDSTLRLNLLDSLELKDWYILEKKDTKNYIVWLKDSVLYNKESVNFTANYFKLDSLENFIEAVDTLNMKFFEQKKDKKKTTGSLSVELNFNEKKKIDFNENVKLTFSIPLKHWLKDSVQLFEEVKSTAKDKTKKEKIWIKIPFEIDLDTLNYRALNVFFDKKEKTNYKIKIDSASFVDIFENKNLLFEKEFDFQEEADYGEIKLNLQNIQNKSIVQLLDDKKKVLNEFYIDSDTILNFRYLQVKEYYLKVISDNNGNKKWDSGNFQKKLLPERVYLYKDKIELKANWTNDIDWFLNDKIIIQKQKKANNKSDNNEKKKTGKK